MRACAPCSRVRAVRSANALLQAQIAAPAAVSSPAPAPETNTPCPDPRCPSPPPRRLRSGWTRRCSGGGASSTPPPAPARSCPPPPSAACWAAARSPARPMNPCRTRRTRQQRRRRPRSQVRARRKGRTGQGLFEFAAIAAVVWAVLGMRAGSGGHRGAPLTTLSLTLSRPCRLERRGVAGQPERLSPGPRRRGPVWSGRRRPAVRGRAGRAGRARHGRRGRGHEQ